jgi:hypothetical protein
LKKHLPTPAKELCRDVNKHWQAKANRLTQEAAMLTPPTNLKRKIILLVLSIGMLSACQTFNIQIIHQDETERAEPLEAATLPAKWTPTPIPEALLPLTSLTPRPPDEYSTGPEWDQQTSAQVDGLNAGRLGDFVNFTKVQRGWLFVADNTGVLTIFYLLNPSQPEAFINIELGYERRDYEVQPGDPFAESNDFLAAEVKDVELQDDLLAIATIHRLVLVDLSDRSQPVLLSQTDLSPEITDIQFHGDLMRVLSSERSTGTIGFREIDISKPGMPEIVFESKLQGFENAHANLQGDLIYVTDRTLENADHLKIYAVSENTSPTQLGEVFGAPAFRAWVEDRFAYISTGRVESSYLDEYHTSAASIWVVDLVDPENPESFSYIWAPDIATDFYITDDLAVAIGDDLDAALGDWGSSYWMIVADMSDPENPLVFKTLELPGQGMDLASVRGLTFVAAGEGGLQILRPEEGQALRVMDAEDFDSGSYVNARDPDVDLEIIGEKEYKSPLKTATAYGTDRNLNVDEYPGFSVYWDRILWARAAVHSTLTENFEFDEPGAQSKQLPYRTSKGFTIEGVIHAWITEAAGSNLSGNVLQIQDLAFGALIGFPTGVRARSYGFDYLTGIDWQLVVDDVFVDLPDDSQGFVGVVREESAPTYISFVSDVESQFGLQIDNLTLAPFPITPTAYFGTPTPTPDLSFYLTGTPTAPGFDE